MPGTDCAVGVIGHETSGSRRRPGAEGAPSRSRRVVFGVPTSDPTSDGESTGEGGFVCSNGSGNAEMVDRVRGRRGVTPTEVVRDGKASRSSCAGMHFSLELELALPACKFSANGRGVGSSDGLRDTRRLTSTDFGMRCGGCALNLGPAPPIDMKASALTLRCFF